MDTGLYRKQKYTDPAVASEYDSRRFGSRSGKRLNQATRKALAAALQFLSDGDTVLDLPAGTGRWTELVLRNRLQYTGADVSKEMLEVCRQKHQSIRNAYSLVQCDATALPFPDKSFDCILTFKFLSLLPKDVRIQALREMNRVSRQYLVAQSSHLRSWNPFLDLKLLFSRLFNIQWRLKKYEKRMALRQHIESAGWTFTAKIPVRVSLFDYVWPFGREYLAVYETRNQQRNPQGDRNGTSGKDRLNGSETPGERTSAPA